MAEILTSDGRDPINWARFPVSKIAVSYAIDGARTHGGLEEIVSQYKERGITDKAGNVLKLWNASEKRWIQP